MAPYFSTVLEPNNHPEENAAEPSENFALEYVYGYRTSDCPHNLFFSAEHKVVYNVATLGIVLDPKTNTQTFFGGESISKNSNHDIHNSDIMCLSISTDRKYIATGQFGEEPSLFIWDAANCKLKSPKSKFIIKDKDVNGIKCCSWSTDGQYVSFFDMHSLHNLYVLEVDTGAIVFKDKSGGSEVFDIGWSKGKEKQHFASCGITHIKFWDLLSKTSKIGTGVVGKTFCCLTYGIDGSCYAGGTDGKIYLFQNGALTNTFAAHTGLIHALSWADDKLLSGGQDKILNVFDMNLVKESSTSLPAIPRALDMHNGVVLAGLRNGTICFITKGKITQEIMKSHDEGEVWGLEVTNSGDIFTTGDDNKLMWWNANEKKCKGEFEISQKITINKPQMTILPDSKCSRAICFNEQSKEIALATNAGEIQIREFPKMETVKKFITCGNTWIEFISYSPNKKFLAVCTRANTIVVYNADTYSAKGTLKGHNSPVQSLDWSKDSKYIRSCAENFEIMFFDVENMQRDINGASSTKDLEWASLCVKIDWNLQGVYPKGVHGSQVNSIVKSASENFIAAGDDWGIINIYRRPCLPGHKGKAYKYI